MILHASTVLARSPTAILSHLSKIPKALSKHPLLFTLSSNTPTSSLELLISTLTRLSSHENIGCISAPLPTSPPLTGDYIACSLAFFDKETCVPFRSDIPGRADTQVGRWHAMRKKGDSRPTDFGGLEDNVNWEDVWSRSVQSDDLPLELKAISPSDVHTVITLTDNHPEGLNNALSAFTNATKVGLIAASTPFVTGRPFTLLHDQLVYSAGAVGLALTSPIKPTLVSAFPGLKAITPVLTVTRSEGNLVHELDCGNPSQLLLTAIQKSGIDSEAAKIDDFCLSVIREDQPTQVYRIMSGDPKRGTVSLESDAAPVEGTSVQLCHRSVGASTELPRSLLEGNPQRQTLTFLTSLSDVAPDRMTQTKGQGNIQVFENTFLASSENGFILNRVDESATWRCTVGGGLTTLTW